MTTSWMEIFFHRHDWKLTNYHDSLAFQWLEYDILAAKIAKCNTWNSSSTLLLRCNWNKNKRNKIQRRRALYLNRSGSKMSIQTPEKFNLHERIKTLERKVKFKCYLPTSSTGLQIWPFRRRRTTRKFFRMQKHSTRAWRSSFPPQQKESNRVSVTQRKGQNKLLNGDKILKIKLRKTRLVS